jgi:hypothetical protein
MEGGGVFFNTSPQSSLWAGLWYCGIAVSPRQPLHELLDSRSFLLDSMCRPYRLLTGEISQFSNATSALHLIHQFFPLLSIASSTATPYILEGVLHGATAFLTWTHSGPQHFFLL